MKIRLRKTETADGDTTTTGSRIHQHLKSQHMLGGLEAPQHPYDTTYVGLVVNCCHLKLAVSVRQH